MERWRAKQRRAPRGESSAYTSVADLIAAWRTFLPLDLPEDLPKLGTVPRALVYDLYPLSPAAVYNPVVAALTDPRADTARVGDMLVALLWDTPWLDQPHVLEVVYEDEAIGEVWSRLLTAHGDASFAWMLYAAVGEGSNPWSTLAHKIYGMGVMLCSTGEIESLRRDDLLPYRNRCTPTIRDLGIFVREIAALPEKTKF